MTRTRLTALRHPALTGSLAALAGAAMLAVPLAAQAQDSGSTTVKLIQLLIAKGVLTSDQAASLLSQAQSESHAQHTARPIKGAHTPLTGEPPPDEAAVPQGTVRVTYVPQIVRDQLAAEVRQQVLGEVQTHGWATPDALPEWTKRITVYGDLRGRGERIQEDKNNASFFDFNGINNSANGFDTSSGGAPGPVLNTTEDRTRFRLRARLGVNAVIDDWVSANIRIGTGNDSSPVSANQTLGAGAGNFSKYALWLDRAYFQFEAPKGAVTPFSALKSWVGRSPNPFWTTDLVYDESLNFDGVSVQAALPVTDKVTTWLTTGAFPVFNTDLNFATTNVNKFPSRDKYLFAAQLGVDWQPTPIIAAKFGAGLFDYSNIEGKLSSLCDLTVSTACNTDVSRSGFSQGGNTVFPVRNIDVSTQATLSTPQFFGLASRFDVLDLHGRVIVTKYDPVDVAVEGEFLKNLAFNRAAVANRGPLNNFGASPDNGKTLGQYVGGDTGYLMKLTVGTPEIVARNQWNAYFGYKYLESDATPDGLTDSNFHGGGTNAKGYFIGAGYGLAHNTYLTARWLSADQVSGPAFHNDVIQIDFNTKF